MMFSTVNVCPTLALPATERFEKLDVDAVEEAVIGAHVKVPEESDCNTDVPMAGVA